MSMTATPTDLSPKELLADARQLLAAGEVVAAALLVEEAARLVDDVPERERPSCRRMVEDLVMLFAAERERLSDAHETLASDRRALVDYAETTRED